MAVPKRKTSTSKSRKRRTHYKAAVPASSMCPECNEKMHPHRACPHCGYYKGKTYMRETGEAEDDGDE
ncbi:MAG: 50S ribosomal protein L32 [Candidatus Dadabacteria bacterium]|nr:50S ribosomal protein L32 [Candidatus Dadabacteria bacterium]MCY4047281.1 50S ribosomal protein L32 [Candidatus Dadabacteria bacterium]